MSLKSFLIETTVASDVATYDKKIGEEPTIKRKFTTKDDISKIIKKLKELMDIVVNYNPVAKNGIVTGVKYNVETFIKQIKGL